MKVTARKSTGGPESEGGVTPAMPLLFNADGIIEMPPRTGICRTCLITRPQNRLLGIFLHWTPPWKTRKSSDDCIANQITKLTGVEIDKSDGFSQHICFPCFQNLKEAYTFYYRVRHHDNVMRSNQLLVQSPSLSMSKLIESWRMPGAEADEDVMVPDAPWKPTEVVPLEELGIKQEVLSDGDGEPSGLLESNYEAPIADIKIEPEELTSQTHNTVKLNDDRRKSFKTRLWSSAKRKKRGFKKIKKKTGLTEKPSTSKIVISSSYSMEPGSKTPNKNTSTDNNFQEVAVKEELGSDSEDLDCDLSLDCMLCFKQFNTISGLKAHVISSHSYKSVMRKRALINAKFGRHAEDKEPTPHMALSSCLDCGKTFSTSESVDAHARIHKKSCEKCNMYFTSFVSLARHMRVCTALPVASAPQRKTKTVQQLRRECAAEATEVESAKRKKSTEQTYECSECKETFDEILYLKIHNEVHHNASDTNTKSKKEESNGIESNETVKKNIEVQHEMSSPGQKKAQTETDNLLNVLDTPKQLSYTINNIESADKELLESILEPDTTDIDLGILAEEAKRSEIATSGPASIESVEQENTMDKNHCPASKEINKDTIENKDYGQGIPESIEEETTVEKDHCSSNTEIIRKENPVEENYTITEIIQEHNTIEKDNDNASADNMEEIVVKKYHDSTSADSMEVITVKRDHGPSSVETMEEIAVEKDHEPASADSMKEIVVTKFHDSTRRVDSMEVITVKKDHGPSSIEAMEEITVEKEHDSTSVKKITVEKVHGTASAESIGENTVKKDHSSASAQSIEEENNTEKDHNHQSAVNMEVKTAIEKNQQGSLMSDEHKMEIEEYETVASTEMEVEKDQSSNERVREKDNENDCTGRNDQVSHNIAATKNTTLKNDSSFDFATSNADVDKATNNDNVVKVTTGSDNVVDVTMSNDNDVTMSNDNAIDAMVEDEEDEFELKLAFEDSQSPDLNKEISKIANSALLSDTEVCESAGQECE